MGDVKPTRGNDGGGEFFAPVLQPASREGLRYRLYRLMFHHESSSERNFDLALIAIIVASVLVVLLDSDPDVKARWHVQLYLAEWVFTLLFAVEYSVRIWVDEQGLPDKVRVSLNWRERLANGALGEAVTQSFLLINHFHHVYRASLYSFDMSMTR